MQNLQSKKIGITGIVQGVGFRPFVYSLAKQYHLTGWVRNTSKGVEILVSGVEDVINQFISQLKSSPPPLARIDHFSTETITYQDFSTFDIFSSKPNPGDFIPISPDMSICEDCQDELFDSSNFRYRYPFINCTNCGPRFSIIKNIPYDRPYTTMADFPMCELCRSEYENPLNRRFHAQPVACPACGPQVKLITKSNQISGEEAIQQTRSLLKSGKILAIKGLGGYHLACDAKNETAVSELRNRKKRSDKPFALMANDVQTIQKYCLVSEEEENLLSSRQRPIVILDQKENTDLSSQIAPFQTTLGFMLPYTPLHYLLLEPASDFPEVLVMTSANLSDEPIVYKDEDAFTRLGSIADAFLIHNREIYMRVDDSVTRVIHNHPYILRRSRGYSPNSIHLPFQTPQILAAGAELKNTFCLTREDYAFLSHHIGDLENLETLEAFEAAIQHYQTLFSISPQIIAADLHPNYLATRYAKQRANENNLPLYLIQHHHAHLASCLADNGWMDNDKPVIGLIFDGTGYGPDGAIWGGEVLIGNYKTFDRVYHLKYIPLAGGDLATKTPARVALSHLWNAGLPWEEVLPCTTELCMEERTVLRNQLELGINAVPTSSMGRLFDAAAAMIGVRQKVNYEAQAAIEMEQLVDSSEKGSYDFQIEGDEINPAPLWEALIHDKYRGLNQSVLTARFHNSIMKLCLDCCLQIRTEKHINTVVLSGGVWQNKVLLNNTIKILHNHRFDVLTHQQTPPNDGGIALGQAVIAALLNQS
ncbi:MAG: carbamoyltransferase HypF [Anaerolineaceae bacterium]|nr:carbamoyltransferase HypF [Anaerolineaceae bacterium]